MKTSLLSFSSLATMVAAQGSIHIWGLPSISGAPRPTTTASVIRIGGAGGGVSGVWPAKPVVVTTIVDSFVSIFPEPTTVTIDSQCYTATTTSQPITISNCPCTVVHSPPTSKVPPGTTTLVTGRLVTPIGSATIVPPPPSQQTGAQSAATSFTTSTTTTKPSGTPSAVPGQPSSPYVQAGGSVNIPHVIAVLLAAVTLAAGMAL